MGGIGTSTCYTSSLLTKSFLRRQQVSHLLNCCLDTRSKDPGCSEESLTGVTEPENPVAAYVCEMRKKLQEMAELVQVNAKKAQQKQKVYYDCGVQQRVLKEGEKFLVLLPNARNRLKLEYVVGPYEVKRKVSDVDYEVEMRAYQEPAFNPKKEGV